MFTVERLIPDDDEREYAEICRYCETVIKRASSRNSNTRCRVHGRYLQCIEFQIDSYFHVNDAIMSDLMRRCENHFADCTIHTACESQTSASLDNTQSMFLTCRYKEKQTSWKLKWLRIFLLLFLWTICSQLLLNGWLAHRDYWLFVFSL